MPYKSKAQQRLFHAKEARGEISKKTVDEYDESTDFSHLPEHVGKWKKGKAKMVHHSPTMPQVDHRNQTTREVC